mmetsp:Transcript_119049/g.210541  ORF Transcript_119049/g.210541 Transcript_119049/m.210541 type:complete len:242 (-) Transcript_119049:341-1066(-)
MKPKPRTAHCTYAKLLNHSIMSPIMLTTHSRMQKIIQVTKLLSRRASFRFDFTTASKARVAATMKEPKQMEPKDVTKAAFKLRLTGESPSFPKYHLPKTPLQAQAHAFVTTIKPHMKIRHVTKYITLSPAGALSIASCIVPPCTAWRPRVQNAQSKNQPTDNALPSMDINIMEGCRCMTLMTVWMSSTVNGMRSRIQHMMQNEIKAKTKEPAPYLRPAATSIMGKTRSAVHTTHVVKHFAK